MGLDIRIGVERVRDGFRLRVGVERVRVVRVGIDMELSNE